MSAPLRVGLTLAGVLVATGCDRATVILEPDPPTRASTAPDPNDPAASLEREQEAVREALRRYDAALAAREPNAACEAVVHGTFDYYEDLRIAALRATRDQLESWDLMSVILVLQIRAQLDRETLEAADGRALFERAVREGLVGEDLDAIALDEVWIDEDRTRAEIRIDGEAIVWLQREDGSWRVDIPKMIQVIGPAIEAAARERVVADGKVRAALTFVELSSEDFIDLAVLDGPLEQVASE